MPSQTKSDTNAVKRMRKHREEMEEMGFKALQTYVPETEIDFIEKEQKMSGLRSRGHQIASALSELRDLRQFKQQMESAQAG